MKRSKWHRVRLRFTAEVAPSTRIDHLSPDKEVTFLPLETIWADDRYEPSRLRPAAQVLTGYTRFQEGDVLVPKITPTFEAARSAIASGLQEGVGFGTTELHVLRPTRSLDARFLWYRTLARDFISRGTSAMVGVAGQKRVPLEFIKDFSFDVPPLDEQRRITDFLDTEVAKLQRLIRLKRELATRLPERLHAVMRSAIADLPRDARLGYSGSWYSGGTPSKEVAGHWSGSVPWASTKDLGNDELYDTRDHVTLEAAQSYSRLIPERSLLIATRGMALAKRLPLAITHRQMAFNQDLKALVPTAGIEVDFLRVVLRGYESEVLAAVVESAHGTRRLETRHLKALRIPLPGVEVQRRVVSEVREVEAHNQAMGGALNRQMELLTERCDALITGVVTGELDTSRQTPVVAA